MLPNNQDPNHKFVDFNWRAFTVNQPIVLSYPDNKTGATKNIEINYMSGVLNGSNAWLYECTKEGWS